MTRRQGHVLRIGPVFTARLTRQGAPQLSGVSAALKRPPVPRPGLDSTRPGRRLLDDREMEMIELGGAPP